MSSPLPQFLTAAEAATILRITPIEASRLCQAGSIKAKKPGLKWLIDPADLQAYIDRNDDADVA